MRTQKSSLVWLTAICLFLSLPALATAAQGRGTVIVAGPVNTTVEKAGLAAPAVNGQKVKDGSVVVTGNGGSATLVFGNGATITIGSNTRLAIDEFLMSAPRNTGVSLGDLQAEPSSSTTKLDLQYGSIVGEVKKLKSSSAFDISTPAGAAGIRGTTFSITVTAGQGGNIVVSIAVGTGRVDVTVPGTGKLVRLLANKQVVITGQLVNGRPTNIVADTGQVPYSALSAIALAVNNAIRIKAQYQVNKIDGDPEDTPGGGATGDGDDVDGFDGSTIRDINVENTPVDPSAGDGGA